jgi:hypothetical protein
MSNKKTTLKATPPKASDVVDINYDISATAIDVETLSKIFEAAVVELGRQISKGRGHGQHYMDAIKITADLNEVLSKMKNFSGWGARSAIPEELGYSSQYWTATGCVEQQVDFDDLYEKSEGVTVAIHYSRKAKPKDMLKKLGAK